jgi:hypothetical protein
MLVNLAHLPMAGARSGLRARLWVARRSSVSKPAECEEMRSDDDPATTWAEPGARWGRWPADAKAQRAVDYLSDQEFPVQQVTIVGVDLMQVERVTGRLTWPRVLGGGALTGAWLGVFIGLVLGLFSGSLLGGALAAGLVAGVFFGLITSAVQYAMARGTRDFSSTLQLVAGRYDVLCDPKSAEQGRDLLARLTI